MFIEIGRSEYLICCEQHSLLESENTSKELQEQVKTAEIRENELKSQLEALSSKAEKLESQRQDLRKNMEQVQFYAEEEHKNSLTETAKVKAMNTRCSKLEAEIEFIKEAYASLQVC